MLINKIKSRYYIRVIAAVNVISHATYYIISLIEF